MEVTPWAKICFSAIFLNTIATYSPATIFDHAIIVTKYFSFRTARCHQGSNGTNRMFRHRQRSYSLPARFSPKNTYFESNYSNEHLYLVCFIPFGPTCIWYALLVCITMRKNDLFMHLAFISLLVVYSVI